MPVLALKPFADAPKAGSGFSIALSETKAGQHVRIGLTETACKELAKRKLDPKTDCLKLQINSDAGRNHLMTVEIVGTSDPDSIPLSASTRGGVFCKLSPWRQVPTGKIPSKPMALVGKNEKAVIVKLPDWARPDPVKRAGSGIMGD